MRFEVKVYRVGDFRYPHHVSEFIGSPEEGERYLSNMWDRHTPADGTGYRATLREVGQRRIISSIGW